MTQLIFYTGSDDQVRSRLSAKGSVLTGSNSFELLSDADLVVTDKTTPNEQFWAAQATCVRNVPTLAIEHEASGVLKSFKHPRLTCASVENIESFLEKHPAPWKLYPTYFLCDAIDGAGKGKIAEAVKEWGKEKARHVFDITQFSNTANHIPSWAEIQELAAASDMLIFQEPSFSWLGAIIRKEMIAKENKGRYSAISTAAAYALDREFIFNRLVIPALAENKIVFSDRGRITSDTYQPVQAEQNENYDRDYFLSYVRGLPGNQREESCTPGLLLVPVISAGVTEERRKQRAKDDNAIFEVPVFQQEIAKIYAGDRIKRQYKLRGTEVVDLPMADLKTPEDTKRFVKEILFKYEEKFWTADWRMADRGI